MLGQRRRLWELPVFANVLAHVFWNFLFYSVLYNSLFIENLTVNHTSISILLNRPSPDVLFGFPSVTILPLAEGDVVVDRHFIDRFHPHPHSPSTIIHQQIEILVDFSNISAGSISGFSGSPRGSDALSKGKQQ